MREYSLTKTQPRGKGGWGEIKFQTPDAEMYEFVSKYMDTIIDAFRWQNHIERVEPSMKIRV